MKLRLRFNIKYLSILFGVAGVFGSVVPGKALPFLPAAYISVSGLWGSGELTGHSINSNTFTDLTINNESKTATKGFLVSAGIAPNIPLPFINGLRGELAYGRTHSNNLKDNMIGVGLYYDALKFLPFVNPYAGIMLYSYNATYDYNVNYKDGSTVKSAEIKESKGSQILTSFSLGLNLNIPVSPLQVFAEYRYSTSKLFPNHFDLEQKFDNNYIRINHGNYSSFAGVIGVRYFII